MWLQSSSTSSRSSLLSWATAVFYGWGDEGSQLKTAPFEHFPSSRTLLHPFYAADERQDYCLLSEDFTNFSFHYLGLPEFVRRCTDTIAAAQHCGKGKRLCTCSQVALDNVNSNSWNILGMVNYGELDANVDWSWLWFLRWWRRWIIGCRKWCWRW